MEVKNHKYTNLAQKIKKEYSNLCSNNTCGECKYAFQSNCKILFVLDYMDKYKTLSKWELDTKEMSDEEIRAFCHHAVTGE